MFFCSFSVFLGDTQARFHVSANLLCSPIPNSQAISSQRKAKNTCSRSTIKITSTTKQQDKNRNDHHEERCDGDVRYHTNIIKIVNNVIRTHNDVIIQQQQELPT
jgi:hypothetical protein